MSLRHACLCVLLNVLVVAPASGAEPARRHLVFVAELRSDGSVASERQVACDLARACEIVVPLGLSDLDRLHLRIFAEDGGGFSIVPIGADVDGHLAVGLRKDVACGSGRSSVATIPVRPLRPMPDDESSAPFGVTMREDLPAVARVMVAVAELPRGR